MLRTSRVGRHLSNRLGRLRRAAPLRPAFERLEDRTMLDADFSNLATEVDDRLVTLQDTLDVVIKTTAELPVLGSKIDQIASNAKTTLNDLRTELKKELGKLKVSDAQNTLQQNLRKGLEQAGLLHDVAGNGYQDDVIVEKDAAGTITIIANLGKNIDGLPSFTFGTGLPGLGFRVLSGGLEVNATLVYDQLKIGLNPDKTPFFDANSQDDEFKVIVGAGLKNGAQITADLGFLSIVATDNTVSRNELQVQLVADVQGTSISTMRFGDVHLQGAADINLHIRAAFDTAGLTAGSEYPTIHADFVMQWNLNGASSSADTKSLGQEPNIRFENVTLNVGTFLNTMIGPVARTIRDFMRPMDPILKIITTEIPLLTDIGKEVGLGPVTLKSLAVVAGQTAPLPPDYELLLDLFNASTALHQLLIQVDQNDTSLEFNVGSFDLSGKDPRTATFDSTLTAANLTDLIPRAVGQLRSINQQLQQSTPDELKPVFTLIDQRLRSAQNGAGFSFPMFDDPLSGVFRLFLGQDTDFVKYTAQFHIDGNRTQLLPLPIPLLPNLVNLRLNVQYDADAYLKVGYDTYGLRTFLKTFDVGQLANGLYFDAQKPLLTMGGSVSAGLAVGLLPNVKVPVLGVEVPTPPNISINGQLSLEDVLISFAGNSPKFRLLEAAPDPLFNTQGLVKAAFTIVAEAGVPGAPTLELYKKILSERVLFDLYSGTLSNPSNPFRTPQVEEPPVVDVIIDLNRPKHEWFTGQGQWPSFLAWAGNNGVPDTIEVVVRNGYAEVRYNGFLLEKRKQDKFLGSFWIKGTEDDDLLIVDGHLDRPLAFQGGLGLNSLTLDDRGVGGGIRTGIDYTVSRNKLNRRAIDTIGNFISGDMPITHSRTTNLTLFTSDLQGVLVNVSELYNNELNLVLGRFANSVNIDTTFGGSADKIIITSPLDLGLPFRPLGPTRLVVDDQTEADNFLHGPGHYVVTDDRLTRQKFMPLRSDNPRLIAGGGVTTIDYSAIKVVDFTLQGGDRGNDIDIQTTSASSRYTLTGGAGADTFTIGQVHHTLPGGTGLERQLGFAAVDMKLDGGGGFGDKLVLDDTGTDFLPYTVRSTYDIFNSFVGLVSVQELGAATKTVSADFTYLHIEDVTVKTGGITTVNVHDTVSVQDGIFDRGQTHIVGGSHTDIVNVLGTSGTLIVDGGGGSNFITVGAVQNDTGSLDLINGDVRLTGQAAGALNFVTIMDKLNDLQLQYSLDDTLFERSGSGSSKYVVFDGMAIFALAVRCGDGGNAFRINGTPALNPMFGTQVDIYTGDNDDFATVRGSGGPVSLNLGLGVYQTVTFGDDDASLDAIHGDFTVTGSGFIDAFVSNEAATSPQYVNIDQSVFFRQTLDRYIVVDEQVQYLNRIRFPSFEELRLQYTAGGGGDAVFITAVDPKATVLALGAAGVHDTWGVGFGANMNEIQGPVFIYGQTADYDFSYYYDYLDTSPHSYQFTPHPSDPQALVAERTGIAAVTFNNLNQVIFYSPVGGGSTTRVDAVPAQMLLNMAVGDGDVVTLGANPPAATLAGILGTVSVGPGAVNGKARLILDDSGNTTTARDATLTPSVYKGIALGTIAGFAPGTVLFRDQANWTVDIRAGALDDRFHIAGEFNSAIFIDGGGGVNTLDYGAFESDATVQNINTSFGGQISLYNAEGNALDSVDGNHGTLVGGVTFAEGRIGQAFSFDGMDDFVRVNNAPNLEPVAISVEAWVRMADVNRKGYILAKGASESLASSYYFYVGDGLTFNIFSEGVFSQDSGAIIRSFAGSPADGSIYDGQWHHIVGSYDGAMVRLFVDGTEIGEGVPASFDIGYDMPVSNDLFVGSYNGSFGFDGLIDDVSIFNRALSAAEVLARYNSDAGGTPPAGAGVYVNLQTHAATGLAGGIENIQNVIGSDGDDVLVGNGGNLLEGRGGRDFLIAGALATQLLGGDGADLLIAGTTAYDLDASALATIHAEWMRTDVDYQARVDNLTTDNGTPVPKLIASDSVESNGGGNSLFGDDDIGGDGALDLFFASLDLDSADDSLGEILVSI
jgi:hypothetical protein